MEKEVTHTAFVCVSLSKDTQSEVIGVTALEFCFNLLKSCQHHKNKKTNLITLQDFYFFVLFFSSIHPFKPLMPDLLPTAKMR